MNSNLDFRVVNKNNSNIIIDIMLFLVFQLLGDQSNSCSENLILKHKKKMHRNLRHV